MSQPSGEGKQAAESPRVTIRGDWCKGCAFCVHVCTKGVLRMEGPRPVVAKPEACTGCSLCGWICPDFAIEVERNRGKPDPEREKDR